jgi:hypothetical protein
MSCPTIPKPVTINFLLYFGSPIKNAPGTYEHQLHERERSYKGPTKKYGQHLSHLPDLSFGILLYTDETVSSLHFMLIYW